MGRGIMIERFECKEVDEDDLSARSAAGVGAS